jgi:hypothetical protein
MLIYGYIDKRNLRWPRIEKGKPMKTDARRLPPPNIRDKSYDVPLDKLWEEVEELAKLTRHRLMLNNCGGLPAPAVPRNHTLSRIFRRFRKPRA